MSENETHQKACDDLGDQSTTLEAIPGNSPGLGEGSGGYKLIFGEPKVSKQRVQLISFSHPYQYMAQPWMQLLHIVPLIMLIFVPYQP